MVKLLLAAGASPNPVLPSATALTALQVAAERGYVDIARLLVQHGVS